MELFYQFTIIDDIARKEIKGVIKGSDILEMVRALAQKYKSIEHLEMKRIPTGTVLFETNVSHLKREDLDNVQQ